MRRIALSAGIILLFSAAAAAEEALVPQTPPAKTQVTVSKPAAAPAPAAAAPAAPARDGYPDVTTMVEDSATRAMRDAQTNAEITGMYVATSIRDDIYEGSEKLYNWLLTPPDRRPPHAVPASYCYRSFQDVQCYRRPMPGWEHRLVGYQGTGAKAPPPSVTKLLPTRAEHTQLTAQERAKDSAPVFKQIPKDEKPAATAPATTDGALIPDPNNQAIPTSASSPQL